ncbi:MAG: hypothetical protein ACRDA3_05530 [Peptostreptococcaceae bacterium]
MNHEKEWEEIINDVNLMNKEKGKLALLCGLPILLAFFMSTMISLY